MVGSATGRPSYCLPIATCRYYTGIDPFTKKPVPSATNVRDRKHQRTMMQFFKSENCCRGEKGLMQASRADLMSGRDGLILPNHRWKPGANAALRGAH